MPIIIETPAPPTRERLVLVSPSSVSNPIETLNGEVFTVHTTEARDATPADLERAGYVTGEMLAEQVRIVWAASQDAIARAEKAERTLREQVDPGTLAHLRNDLRDMTARAEKAERLHSEAEAQIACRSELRAKLAEAERERDAARAELAAARADATRQGEDAAHLRCRMAELRDTLTDERDCGQDGDVCAKPPGCARHWEARCRELAAERDTLRAELARLKPDGVDEPLDVELGNVFAQAKRDNETKGRATDEELSAIALAAYDAEPTPHVPWLSRVALAVAARVRQEPGLAEQLVGDPRLDSVSVDAVMGGAIRVRVVRRVDSLANTLGTPQEAYCSRADVLAGLARLAGLEVER